MKLLKAVIVSHKDGVPCNSLDDDYAKIVGESIPYLQLGFVSLYDFLRRQPDIYVARNEQGDYVYKVEDSKISHIQQLINKQKDAMSRMIPRKNVEKDKDAQRTKWYRDDNLRKTKYPKEAQRAWYDKRRSDNRNREHNSRRSPTNYPRYGERKNKSVSFDDEEYAHPVISIENRTDEMIFEPLIRGKQLIGDDFFLQLAIRNLGVPCWRERACAPLHCGLCISGQTIRDCTRRLRKIECLSNRIIILLGSVDVYKKQTSDEMIEDMEELLDVFKRKFAFSPSAITLCTIPPLANRSILYHHDEMSAFAGFNNWLRSICDNVDQIEWYRGYNLIDLHHYFMSDGFHIDYSCFQNGARMISGCRYPYVLWNQRGRKLAVNLLSSSPMSSSASSSSSRPATPID